MNFSRYRIDDFLSVLAAKDAVPGGGGASALVGALGAALGCMVGNLTVGKKKYADVETDMYLLMAEADSLQKELTALIQKDADGFEPLSKAYAMDKSDPNYDTVMEDCLRRAAATPREIMRLSCTSSLQKRAVCWPCPMRAPVWYSAGRRCMAVR